MVSPDLQSIRASNRLLRQQVEERAVKVESFDMDVADDRSVSVAFVPGQFVRVADGVKACALHVDGMTQVTWRLDAGIRFPRHRHRMREDFFVLSGSLELTEYTSAHGPQAASRVIDTVNRHHGIPRDVWHAGYNSERLVVITTYSEPVTLAYLKNTLSLQHGRPDSAS